jgi:hypothetical protein
MQLSWPNRTIQLNYMEEILSSAIYHFWVQSFSHRCSTNHVWLDQQLKIKIINRTKLKTKWFVRGVKEDLDISADRSRFRMNRDRGRHNLPAFFGSIVLQFLFTRHIDCTVSSRAVRAAEELVTLRCRTLLASGEISFVEIFVLMWVAIIRWYCYVHCTYLVKFPSKGY